MNAIIVYFTMAVLGYLAAVPLRKSRKSLQSIGLILKIIVTALAFVMGFRIAANREIVADIAVIGAHSLLMAVGSLMMTIGTLSIMRRLMGFDKYGRMVKKCDTTGPDEEIAISSGKMPFWRTSPFRMGTAVSLGAVAGYLSGVVWEWYDYEAMYSATGVFVTCALYFMVFLASLNAGSDKNTIRLLKDAGIRILMIPVITAVSTLAFILLYGLLLPYSFREMLAVACTFCWFSLGPSIIMDAGFVAAGALAFLTNFLRVIISLITIPVVAKRVGYVETVGMSQSASMDACLATIGEATNRQTVVYAFVSGIVLTVLVPILVPLIVR